MSGEPDQPDPWCGWSVQQTATNRADNNGNQTAVVATEEYIAKEFSKLLKNNDSSTCITIPPTFEKGSDPDRQLGEEAEETVNDKLKNSNIPGMKLLLFNGQRYVGKRGPDDEIVGEKDFSVFIELAGKYFIMLIEVKCIEEQNKNHRKKATRQLRNHCEVLEATHGIPTSEVNKIKLQTAWPRLNREYTCPHCSKQHLVYQRVPVGCPRNNQEQPEYETPGWHVFKETFQDQAKFNRWLKHSLAKENAMDKSCWTKILQIHTQHACGALYDEINKRFMLLGSDQISLRDRPKHELNKPRFVPGIAGAGKTVTVCAKIEKLFKDGEVNAENRVLYICFSDSLIEMVKTSLKGLQIEMDAGLVKFVNYGTWDMKDFFKNKQKMHTLLFEGKFKNIFFDEAEDLGVKELENMIKTVLAKEKHYVPEYFEMKFPLGNFWILFDVFQSEVDTHDISLIGQRRSRLRWNGEFIDETLFKEGKHFGHVIPLRTVFRMTNNILKHIQEKKMNPKLGNPNGSGIEGPKVVREQIVAERHAGQGGGFLTILSNVLFPKIRDVFRKNIHLGDVAILFDSKDIGLVLPEQSGGIDNLITSLNNMLKSAFSKQKKGAPEVTRSIDEGILHSHPEPVLKCKCKMFLGFVDEAKGLTVKDVIYAPFFRGDGTNPLVAEKQIVSRTSPYYKAISRSSCEVNVLEIVLNDQLLQTLGIPLITSSTFETQKHKEAVSKYNEGRSKSPVTKRR